MKAAYYDSYGAADVVSVRDVALPTPGDGDILVKVQSSAISTADWRLRSSNFPGILWLPGRLMTGLFGPKNKVLGTDFAGQVEQVGRSVTRFKAGDRVYGFCMLGGHAEYLTIGADKAVDHIPPSLNFDEAAAVPFGAISALVFLRDFAKMRAGQKVLIIGASGGVGVYAVQLARLMGAHVTGVSSAANFDLVRGLGADQVIDYKTQDYTTDTGVYDVVLDTVGATRFSRIKRSLTPKGLFVPLEFGLCEIFQALVSCLRNGKRVITNVSGDSAQDLAYLSKLLASGDLRVVIDSIYPLDDIVRAHQRVEGRHKTGSVVVKISEDDGPVDVQM